MTRQSPRLRRSLWRRLFDFLAGNYRDVGWWRYMNYGFAPLEPADQAPELAAEDARLAARALGKITGAVGVEDVLGEIFSSFCIGK